MIRLSRFHVTISTAAMLVCPLWAAAASWPMKGHDMGRTGRADFVVPPERLNDTFFNFPLWQKRTPGSPGEGNIGSSSMVFSDGVGPAGEDVVVAGYHWPKGVQCMDRHTGKFIWAGNTAGGETIGEMTPAFSLDGSTTYVTNDATEEPPSWPNGHPLMAFATAVGPSLYWHNGADPNPAHLSMGSPTIAPDGRIFMHNWIDRPYAGVDDGLVLTETWAAATGTGQGIADSSLYVRGGILMVVSAGRNGTVTAHNGTTGAELFSVGVGYETDATPTIDPANGNIYVNMGNGSIYVIGLDKFGNALASWGTSAKLVFDNQPGTNNPQRAMAAGCLSWDGATYYFQTVSQEGDGGLYAINTADGAVKWFFGTSSRGWESTYSSPTVTRNGVVIVGSNDNSVYAAIRDDGSSPTLLDTLTADGYTNARATPTLAPDGRLYLPLRTTWIVGNGDNEAPTGAIENLFACYDVTATAVFHYPPPGHVAVNALNAASDVIWKPITDPAGQFDHYSIYRGAAAFSDVTGMSPIGTASGVASWFFHDDTAVNGVSYHYAVTSVSTTGDEQKAVTSVGPRTPHDDTDLQVSCISRLPRYPRYCAAYTDYQITEPSGFGPYYFSASTALDCGQDANTPRFPSLGDPVTYQALVRNRGTNSIITPLNVSWFVDGVQAATDTQSIALAPNASSSFAFVGNWDGVSHEIKFRINFSDSHSSNNELAINTKSVPFLSYIDRTRIECFREETPGYPAPFSDDFIDWLNNHMVRFNQLFAAAGSPKRVHFDVLEVLDDTDPDPGEDLTPFAIFPFRYHWSEGSARLSGYYDPSEDIDYGLLHEMGHQLGLIDLYQLDLSGSENEVSGLPYFNAPACLMHGVSHFISQHSALGMAHWQDKAHGYYGQYLYGIPAQVRMRFIGMYGQPLAGATVTMYQMCSRPGGANRLTTQIKAQGVTDSGGIWTLPNVPIDHNLVPTTYAGDTLNDNPFGYVAVVGHNGLLHFKVERDGFADYAWLDITECNVAYYTGETASAAFTRNVSLGGDVQHYPPPGDLTENNAASWSARADGATATVSDDATRVQVGQKSVRFDTNGGFDTAMRYAADRLVQWNLTGLQNIRLWCYAVNSNIGFQENTPWVRIGGPTGYFELRSQSTLLNAARDQWFEFVIPFAGDDEWYRTDFGTPDLANINYLELHFDTWGYGFTLWIDGVRLEPAPTPTPGDLNCDRDVNAADVPGFVQALVDPAGYSASHGNCYLSVADMNTDHRVDGCDIQLFVRAILR